MNKKYNVKFGFIPDLPDIRDKYFKVSWWDWLWGKAIPDKIDLRDKFIPCQSQGDLGSCTSFSSLAAAGYLDVLAEKPFGEYSHLFQYYNTREDKNNDTGGSIRSAFKAMNKFGVCHETLWPYDISRFTEEPPAPCYKEGETRQVIQYSRVNQGKDLRVILAQGFPIVYGQSLYGSFMDTGQNGIVRVPDKSKESVIGGHALCIVGYFTDIKCFIVRNSWGRGFGLNGYCLIPFSMIEDENQCCDFWVAKIIEEPEFASKKVV